MPITKDLNNKIVFTPADRKDLFDQTGVMHNGNFAVCAETDLLKQIQLDPSSQSSNTVVTIKSGASSGNTVITLPSSGSTLANSAFKTIQVPAGTSPVASSPTDTLTFTSSDNTVTITGTSGTDTINFQAANSYTLPPPTPTTLGGIESLAQVASNWINSITTSGVPVASQPAFSDISGQTSGPQISQAFYPTNRCEIYEDFLSGSANVGEFTGSANSGSISVNFNIVDGNHPGNIQLQTGASTSSAPSINSNDGMWLFGGGVTTFETLVYLNFLSGSPDTYSLRIGYSNQINGTSPTEGLWFQYTDTVNSGQWVLTSVAGGVTTSTSSAVAPTATAWNKLKIVTNAAGTLATFFVNGTSIGTVAGLPTVVATDEFGIQVCIIKTAGTSSRNMAIDYIYSMLQFTSPR